ncbi:hypothetical protein WSK_1034 [Novosphingobium sp. Rr 2-17]|uniref:hypothetical protein n=1 Tax=Novosphingobium sp. Rr 2-17 TaxID=555793 RepID=UPI0002699B6A|nr:hypothetical protein [Novosphingobium sp. Rr 2-17]EIZ80473.1 hypothetical protein WSK_1034 [Novosphingobium sp. Rr 2-17]
MTTQSARRLRQGLAMASAAALALGAVTAGAQPPGLPPLGAGGPPGGLPPLNTTGAVPDLAPPLPPPPPAEQLAASLPDPQPGTMLADDPLPADSPMPSTDPHNLRGAWHHNQKLEFRMRRDMYDKAVPFTMEGVKILARRIQSLKDGKPYLNASAICRPPGQPWQLDLNMPFLTLQTNDAVEFLFEHYHGRWNIVFDPAKNPPPAKKAYMGYSVGHWVGDTLVVETTGFKQALWLDADGTPLSKNGKLIQRIRKVDNGDRQPFLEIITTFVDPANYTRPWSVVRTFSWQPSLAVLSEYNCEQQIGDPTTEPNAGLVPEPDDQAE